MRKRVVEAAKGFEGWSKYIYLDDKGFISIGYGTTVGQIMDGPTPLSRDNLRIKFLKKGRGFYRKAGSLQLAMTLDSIHMELSKNTKFRKMINSPDLHLSKDESAVLASPRELVGRVEARTDGIILMAYQLGVAGCFGFKNTWKAITRGDWQIAHDEMLDSVWYRKNSPARAAAMAKIILTGVWLTPDKTT